MTLLEVMVAVTILVIVMGTLFQLAVGLGDTAQIQEIKMTSGDEARKAMIYITRDLRQAAAGTMVGAPGATIAYRVATDLDGNGVAVDVGGTLELGNLHTIRRDNEDLNEDGVTDDQLIVTDGDAVQVLANDLLEDEDKNENGVLDPGEDANLNGVLDRGVWFERSGNAVRVTIQTQGRSRQGHLLTSRLSETVLPRN
jgi:type II secretory pathway pseudopilin PulG